MKKILIVDDATANLEAAKQAALQFPEHQFVFTNSANEAFQMIPNVDAVITDLFFVENATGNLASAYQSYVEQVKPELLLPHTRLADYVKKMDASLEVLHTGIPQSTIERLNEAPSIGKFPKIDVTNLFPEFPLGGIIMMSAREHGKGLCLISNVHRHAGSCKDSTTSTAAVVLLSPLLGNILTPDQLLYDGKNSLVYMGEEEIEKYDEKIGDTRDRTGKTDPKVWAEAIRRVLAQ